MTNKHLQATVGSRLACSGLNHQRTDVYGLRQKKTQAQLLPAAVYIHTYGVDCLEINLMRRRPVARVVSRRVRGSPEAPLSVILAFTASERKSASSRPAAIGACC